MTLESIKYKIPAGLYDVLKKKGFENLLSCQRKAIDKGLLNGSNMLVCTPTGSGKTLIAELAAISAIIKNKKKSIYIVPLKALAQEKYREFKQRYSDFANIALSIGDLDSSDPYLEKYDLIITVPEKLDSLIRHKTPWLKSVSTVIIDEIHLIDSANRGPTLEILITIIRKILSRVQIIGLSATIGNPKELAAWLNAVLIEDNWRPVKLNKCVFVNGEICYIEPN